MKRHYVYETTNLINGKKYIGKRTCNCPIEEDKYIGSGKLLKKAIEKYGKENFKKEILQICESEEMAYEWEKVYIGQVKAWESENYYNLSKGGNGGSHGKLVSECTRIKISNAHKGKSMPLKTRELWSKQRTGRGNGMFGVHRFGFENPMYGKKHTEETKVKISSILKGKKVGKYNHKSKSVVLLNTGEVFESMNIASKRFNISSGSVCRCCNKEYKYAGKINGEPAKWMYYEDYLKQNSNS